QVAPADPPVRNPVAAPNGKADAQQRTVEARLRSMLDRLDAPLDVKDFLNPMTFKEFIALTYAKLAERRKDVPILVDAVAFMADDPDHFPNPEALFNSQIKPLIPQEMKNIKLTTAMTLRLALAQLAD